MFTTKQKSTQILLSFAVAALLLVGMGLPHFGMTTSMNMDSNKTMPDCYMPGMTAICNMNPLEHIAAWQSMFTTTLQQNSSNLLALLLAALALAFVWTRLLWQRPKRDPQPAFSIILRRENYLPPSLLQELFSSGILNPKVF